MGIKICHSVIISTWLGSQRIHLYNRGVEFLQWMDSHQFTNCVCVVQIRSFAKVGINDNGDRKTESNIPWISGDLTRLRCCRNQTTCHTSLPGSHRMLVVMDTRVISCYVLYILVAIATADCPENCMCPNSEQLSCVGAGLTSFPHGLATKTLTTVDLTDNDIALITIESLLAIRDVVNLKLTDNNVDTIEDGSFPRHAEPTDAGSGREQPELCTSRHLQRSPEPVASGFIQQSTNSDRWCFRFDGTID